MIVVMTFNDASSASRPPPSSPSILSKFVHQFKSPILLSAETHSLPSGVAPFRRGDGHGCERDGEHGGLLGGRADHPRYELPWDETPSGRGPLTIEIDASNGTSDQVRRAGDHGLHALLRAAHPERRAPRVPEADAVLGRRGPAGRPAPAQGAAGEGHAGGEGGRSCLPHRSGRQGLDRVLRLLSVGSKRFLTSKVDRSVTGLIDPAAMGRLTVGEACTNLVWAAITDIEDVKCSGNWMWASKLEGEGAAMYDCCEAMGKAMLELGIAVDGGKDSLSMAAKVGEEVVKAPGTLVVSVYAGCPDISLTVTPDIKHAGRSSLVFVDLSGGHARLGGSALAQTFKQLGDVTPDCDTALLKRAFRATQRLLRERVLLAGHDRSDGGLLTTVLEMCFGGDCGCVMEATTENSVMEFLFNEELGLVVEVDDAKVGEVLAAYEAVQVPARVIAKTQAANRVSVSVNGAVVLDEDEKALHDLWEATSFELDKLQSNPACAEQEQEGLKKRHKPAWKLTYEPRATPAEWLASASKYRVAIIREEGSNGDCEMAAAMYAAGFEPWDVHVRDLLSGRITLDGMEGSTLGVWVAHGEGRCF